MKYYSTSLAWSHNQDSSHALRRLATRVSHKADEFENWFT